MPVRAEPVAGPTGIGSVFFLTQGVQRRIDVTLSHESGDELRWERVVDMQIGALPPCPPDRQARSTAMARSTWWP